MAAAVAFVGAVPSRRTISVPVEGLLTLLQRHDHVFGFCQRQIDRIELGATIVR